MQWGFPHAQRIFLISKLLSYPVSLPLVASFAMVALSHFLVSLSGFSKIICMLRFVEYNWPSYRVPDVCRTTTPNRVSLNVYDMEKSDQIQANLNNSYKPHKKLLQNYGQKITVIK